MHIHINDIDRGIWSFWHIVLERTEEFIDLINLTPVNIEEWKQQRDIYKCETSTVLQVGFATFFLNRTNRSGIIKDAGVIGGLSQTGNYKLDCRYNKEDLIRRIKRVSKYKGRINLYNMDAVDFINSINEKEEGSTFVCIDPPYFHKESSLYTSFYKNEDHAKLSEAVMKFPGPWIVTYDKAEEISKLYSASRQFEFDINYSVETKRKGTELLIAKDGLILPDSISDRRINFRRSKAA